MPEKLEYEVEGGDPAIMIRPIDIWNAATFDDALARILADAADLIGNYFDRSELQRQEREIWDLRGPPPSNDFAGDFLALKDALAVSIKDRTIRGWHYARLTDEEVAAIVSFGIQASSLEIIRARVDAQVAAGRLTPDEAAALLAGSPYQGEQHDVRTGRFWLTSNPQPIDDAGVVPLLARWGGEAISFGLRDEALRSRLEEIGRPRVIEVAVPVASTDRAYSVACVIISTFARTLGRRGDLSSIDLCVIRDLGAEAILAVHSEGDEALNEIGRGYPPGIDHPV